MLLDRRCKSFGSSDRTRVGGCRSQSGSNSAVSERWEEGENNSFCITPTLTVCAYFNLCNKACFDVKRCT